MNMTLDLTVYHYLHNLVHLPLVNTSSGFLLLYIYDTEHELLNRMLENPELHETIVCKLQQILHQCNPFVDMFRQLPLRLDVHECCNSACVLVLIK